MRVGATLQPKHMELLRRICPGIKVSPKYSLPIFDQGLRGPMKVQFQQALKHYKNDGTPYRLYSRGLLEAFEDGANLNICGGPGCAKYPHELGENKLKLCGRCKDIAYCSKECQTADWEYHKKACGEPKPKRPEGRGHIMMNV